MVSFFGYPSFVDDDDFVGIADGTQAVGYDYHGSSLVKMAQLFHDFFLVVCIQGVGGFVQKDEIGILINGASYQDALPLSLAHAVAFHSYFGVVS